MQQRILDEIQKEKPRIMTPIEAAWLAGVIDGEGSIGLYDYGREGRRVLIQVSNTNEAFVNKMRELIGCGSKVLRTNQHLKKDMRFPHLGRKPIFHYALKGSARCYVVLKQIIPYLIIKKQLAQTIVDEIESKPFGRWKNQLEEKKMIHSERMKETWKSPIMRKRRIEGMLKFQEEKRCRKGLF